MHIVFFVHPDFISSQSMPRYAKMLVEGMRERKHTVEIWTAKQKFYKIPSPSFFKKWLGYLDQFILFPLEVKRKLKRCSSNTLFVFADQALGPWMPLVSRRPFVVHCHDFLAQRSALGKIAENEVKFTGKLYQKMIRNGYRKGKYFISVSRKTRQDLHEFLEKDPEVSKVVYNGLNQNFSPGDPIKVREFLAKKFLVDLKEGYLLHVGGNQFYKNRRGVIRIYNSWRKICKKALPLLMIGAEPDEELRAIRQDSPYFSSIHFHTGISDELLRLSYQGATVFLFPSLEEGFGWPIAEAMASGCPVVTTGEAPMNEVGGEVGIYIPRMPENPKNISGWAKYSASILNDVTELTSLERKRLIESGLIQAKRFDTTLALENIEKIYKEIHQMGMA
ncbi:glycosyltransferase family 1 protein [Gramella sp. BOM4]|nr:glycosyltransferase family 1 protein [Christiangramia bathymodioli]